MARRKAAYRSSNRPAQAVYDEADQGWRGRQKQTEPQARKMAANEVNEANMSSRDSHTVSDECQKSKESSPPNIFNNTLGSLRYLHKKFKRVASAIVEENCEKVKTNANSTASPSKSDPPQCAPLNLNGDTFAVQSHINETSQAAACMQCRKSLNDRQHKFCIECNPELINASAKYGHGVLNEFSKQNVGTRSTSLQAHKHETDLLDNLLSNKCKSDNSFRMINVSPLLQKPNKYCDQLTEELRPKLHFSSVAGDNSGAAPQHFKENVVKAQHAFQALHTATKPSSSVVATKSSVRRKHNERPYSCAPCGIGFKSRAQYQKHCRSASHGIKSANSRAQLQNEDADLDISQSTSSDLELSSCSTTTNSDVISRSTTPLEDSNLSVSHAPLNYSLEQSAAHGTAAMPVPDRPYKPKFHKAAFYQSNSNNNNNNNNPNSISQCDDSKPRALVKAKHAEMMNDNTTVPHQPLSTQSVEYLKEHISKIISQNEAIMEGVEPALQKKYHKITGIPRGSNVNSATEMQVAQASTAKPIADDIMKVGPHEGSSIEYLKSSHRPFPTLQQQAQQALRKSHSSTVTSLKSYSALSLFADAQPLNLTNSAREPHRKQSTGTESTLGNSPVASTSAGDAAVAPSTFYENHHPQNPERSIIKSLLLNSRGLAVPTTGEGEDAVYICPLCNISFRSADNLQYHTKCYCQGTPQVSLSLAAQVNGSPHSAPISPVGSPSHKYFRSNSFNLYRPEKYSPNTLAKLASSSLRHHRTPLSLAKLAAQQAAGYHLNKPPSNVSLVYSAGASNNRTASEFKASASNSSPPTCGIVPETQSVSSQCVQITKQLMDASLPSPGPLLGKTRLVDHYNAPRSKSKEMPTNLSKPEVILVQSESPVSLVDPSKNTPSKEPTQAEDTGARNAKLLQMCGGEVTIVERTEEKIPRFGSSGGSIVSISSSSPDSLPESSPLSIRTGLLSGGSIIEAVPPKRLPNAGSSISNSPAIVQLPVRLNNSQNLMANYFQFPPPINSITAYNPLTLPTKQSEFNADLPAIEATKIVHGGKIIPFVPGIPGPNSLATAPLSPMIASLSQECSEMMFTAGQKGSLYAGNISLGAPAFRSMNLSGSVETASMRMAKRPKSPEPTPKFSAKMAQSSSKCSSDASNVPQNLSTTQHNAWPSTSGRIQNEKPFNFMRIADNLSPPKPRDTTSNIEVSSTNLDKLKPRLKLLGQVSDVSPLHISIESSTLELGNRNIPAHDTIPEKSKPPQSVDDKSGALKHPAKFLRPCSLPLKPGTFTPKKHHGITPTSNTLPLISPETPRPSKNCVQLYLNGHAYTYLGLKCSTKTFYCTLNRPQPVYALFANRPELSMYSNWQTCAENNPHPLGFSPKEVMSLYDSRQRTHNNHQGSKYTTSNKLVLTCAPSDKSMKMLKADDSAHLAVESSVTVRGTAVKCLDEQLAKLSMNQNLPSVPGGYKSNEDYTYVRGRGRGRYVCAECGMRCIKPCTLKKHIRTVHSDVRPYTCQHCMFSFKTKGNLTKHMDSKAHYKKCLEKGINPQTQIDDSMGSEEERSAASTRNLPHDDDGDTISDDCSDGDDLDNDMESSDNEDAKLPDQEAAQCLLSLSQRSACEESTIALVPRQPTTYPYIQSDLITPKAQPSALEYAQNQHDAFVKIDSVISKTGLASDLSKSGGDSKLKRINMNLDVIDLSKPRVSSAESREADTRITPSTSYTGAAELLKSLMTLSDKVPVISPPSFELNLAPVSCNGQQANLLHTYLTERALQKSKMKLSQVHMQHSFDEKSGHKIFKDSGGAFFSMLSKNLDHIEISPKPRTVITPNLEVLRSDAKLAESKLNSDTNHEHWPEKAPNEEFKEKPATIEKIDSEVVQIELHATDDAVDLAKSGQSGMETLAEVAAISVKLDASKSEANSQPGKAFGKPDAVSRKEISAKNIASEFLKLANEDNAALESSTSSDSEAMADAGSKSRRSSLMSFGPAPDLLISARTVVVGEKGFESKSVSSSDVPMVSLPRGGSSSMTSRGNIAFIQEDGGRVRCSMCSASFPKYGQLVLHMNVHYMNPERKFRCESCNATFNTQARLQKHMRSERHNSKATIVETQGTSTSKNPRPFKCADCSIGFRIHGHLAKHLRSKTHVQKLECLQKLPFGTYAMIEESRISLTDIDTTDCDNSLASLKALAEKLKVESSSPDKRKAAMECSESPEVAQPPCDTNTDKNTGALIKKRKLMDAKKL